MKIYFDNVSWSSLSGPNSFASRLAFELSLRGHVIADANDYDVAIVFIEPTSQLNTQKPFIQRIDGIWFHPSEFETKNVNIKNCYKSANAVVFQSDFDQQMVTKWWGSALQSTVIRNGAPLNRVTTNSETLLQLKQRYKKVFVSSSNWHKQKRLFHNIALFKHIRSTLEPYSCLIVMGSQPDPVVADSNIYYTGPLTHEKCLEVFSIADWMIHLAWADHSPNVVVEALSQGCPVICSETGGTQELVNGNGLVLKEDIKYNFELYDYNNPPTIDVTQVTNLPNVIVNCPDLDIKNVANEYENLFLSVMNSNSCV